MNDPARIWKNARGKKKRAQHPFDWLRVKLRPSKCAQVRCGPKESVALARGNHVPGVNLGSELSGRADREFVTFDPDGAFDNAINLQVFATGDLSPDLNAGPKARTAASRGAAGFSCRRLIKPNNWSRRRRRRRNRGWFRHCLLLRPH